MGRTIKFRVWNIFENRWATVSEVEEIVLVNAIYNGGGFQLDERAKHGLANDIGTKIELMQYTGLKDRNGKEIYEGDIVIEPDYSAGAVIFGGSQPIRKVVVEYEIKDSIGKKAGYNLRLGFEKGLYKGEVIGNIYEHPHLLEAK